MQNDNADGTDGEYSRRAVLGATGGLVAGTVFGARQEADNTVDRTMIIPETQVFEDNYAGQFVTINGEMDEEIDASAFEACSNEWPRDETEVYDGRLLDGRSEQPVAMQVPIFTNGTLPPVANGTMFVINSARRCGGEYVRLDAVSVPTRSVVGKPPGPTVEESRGNGMPGFGTLLAGGGIAGGLLVLKLLGRGHDEEGSRD